MSIFLGWDAPSQMTSLMKHLGRENYNSRRNKIDSLEEIIQHRRASVSLWLSFLFFNYLRLNFFFWTGDAKLDDLQQLTNDISKNVNSIYESDCSRVKNPRQVSLFSKNSESNIGQIFGCCPWSMKYPQSSPPISTEWLPSHNDGVHRQPARKG